LVDEGRGENFFNVGDSINLKKIIFGILGIVIILIMAGCTQSSQLINGNAIRVEFINGPELHLDFVKELNQYQTSTLTFRIKNTSQTCITFPYDFGIKIYYENNGSWIETDNMFQYFPKDKDVLLDSVGNIDSDMVVNLSPDIQNVQISTIVNFKATIQGHLCKDKSVVVEKEIPFTVLP
jgi:hypothetical protein